MILNVLSPPSSILRQLRKHNPLKVVVFSIFESKAHDLVRQASDDSSQVGVNQVLRDDAAHLMALEEYLEHQVGSEVHLKVGDEVVEQLGHHSLRHHWLVDSHGDVEGDQQIVGDFHIYLLLLHLELVGISSLLGVTADYLRDSCEDKKRFS